jgi:hypothetical protein
MDNDDSDDETQLPNLKIQSCFDSLKFVSLVVYQMTLLCFVAYYATSRFATIYIKDLFYLFLVIRPLVIVVYTTANSLFSIKASWYITKTLRQEKLSAKELKSKSKGVEDNDDSDDVDVAFGKTDSRKKKIMNIDEQILYEHPDIPQNSELLWNFILQPIIIYGGFGRLVIVSEKKKTF